MRLILPALKESGTYMLKRQPVGADIRRMAHRVLALLAKLLTIAACSSSEDSRTLTPSEQASAKAALIARVQPATGFTLGGEPCAEDYVCYTSRAAAPMSASKFAAVIQRFGMTKSKSSCERPFDMAGGKMLQHCTGYGKYGGWRLAVVLTVMRGGPFGTQTQIAFAPVRTG